MTAAPRLKSESGETVLLGTISLDHYLGTGEILPGGGILNMAWHWATLGRPFRLLTRIGADDGAPIRQFLELNGIVAARPGDLEAAGQSSAIDITIQADRQPFMDNFLPGVWDTYRLADGERRLLTRGSRLHVVLVEGAIAELTRLAVDGALGGIMVSADFLSFRHYDVERFAQTMADVDLGFIGWPGSEDDEQLRRIRDIAFDLGRLVVVTMGSSAILAFDGRASRD
ncbi:MAG: hypothetical protein ABIZ30_08430, partial [Candidatus Limnocylindrales bacterium]